MQCALGHTSEPASSTGHMEQLNNTDYHFEGSAEGDDGLHVPFSLIISDPRIDGDDIFCMVECPVVRERAFKIHGASEKQARELSFEFISSMIEHYVRALYDKNGEKVPLPLQDTRLAR